MTSDTALIEVVVGTTVSVALRNLLIGVVSAVYLFFLAPGLAAQLVIAIPMIILPIIWFGRRLRNVSRVSQDRVADIGAMVNRSAWRDEGGSGVQSGNPRSSAVRPCCGDALSPQPNAASASAP